MNRCDRASLSEVTSRNQMCYTVACFLCNLHFIKLHSNNCSRTVLKLLIKPLKVLTFPTEVAVTMTPLLSFLLPGFLLLGLASPAITDGSVEKLTNGNTDFAAKVYQAVASRTDDNVCLSTFALSSALSALLSATSGPTREQLLQGLGLTGLDAQMLPGTTGLWNGLFSHLKL